MPRRCVRCVVLVSAIAVCALPILVRASASAPIADAAMRQNRAAVRALLQQGADVNAAQGDGMTALHWAAVNGDAELAATLVSAGANVAATTRIDGQTAMHLAAAFGRAEALGVLLTAGADANTATGTGTTALMLASASGNLDSVKLLVAHGANVNVREAAKWHTALMFAAAANHADIVTVLLENGADATATTRVFDLTRAEMPVDRTLQNYALTLVQRQAAEARGEKRPDTAGVDRPYEYNELVAAQGGLTALHFAARQGHADSVKALLAGGVDVNLVSGGVEVTPLAIATINGHFDLAMYLLDRGANPNLVAENGVAPLYAVLNCQWSPLAEYPAPQAYQQQTTSYLELLTALLKKGADPNIRLKKKVWYSGFSRDNSGLDEIGATAFWRAAYANDVEAMRILVAHGADPNIPTIAERAQRAAAGLPSLAIGAPGQTPLHAAAGAGYLQDYAGNGHRIHPAGWLPAVKYLVEELGADVNARDHEGNTAAHYAAARGDDEMLLYLVSRGADVTVVNRRGQTTIDAANGPRQRVQPFPATIDLLERLGAKNNHKCVSC